MLCCLEEYDSLSLINLDIHGLSNLSDFGLWSSTTIGSSGMESKFTLFGLLLDIIFSLPINFYGLAVDGVCSPPAMDRVAAYVGGSGLRGEPFSEIGDIWCIHH